ncbi:MAG: F0F1 ATP synthase subunit B [Candidatus Eisenbacteria bacterium]|nr:F0F1 ATP synthase subunit B [Candidatus Eisenbacteria bacterium]
MGLIDLSQVVTQIIGFLLALYLLKRLAWKPLLHILDERRGKITGEFEEIEKLKGEIKAIELKLTTALKGIEALERAKIQEAISEGQKIAREIRESARDEAKEVIEKAKMEIGRERAKARIELRDEIVDAVVRATERIIKQTLTEENQKKLISDFIEGLETLK